MGEDVESILFKLLQVRDTHEAVRAIQSPLLQVKHNRRDCASLLVAVRATPSVAGLCKQLQRLGFPEESTIGNNMRASKLLFWIGIDFRTERVQICSCA